MTDSIEQQQRKVTMAFKRKVNLEARGGNKYESAELFFAVEDYVPQEATAEDIVACGRQLASQVKATVLDEMGLDWEATEDGLIIESLNQAFGPGVNVTPISSAPSAQPQAAAQTVAADAPPYAGQRLDFQNDKDKLNEQRQWAAQRFAALGPAWESEFYDNRESKKTKNHPDFRHKQHGVSCYVSDVKKAGATI